MKDLNDNNKNVNLILIGKGKKKYVKKVFKFAKKTGVFDKIFYKEKVSQNEIADVYRKCDVFLLPTEYDIFGMVLLEAMYFKIPVVTTLNGGSSVLINNKKNGIICELDIKLWENEIVRILEDKEFKENIIKEEHKTINDNYIWDKLVDKFLKIYDTKMIYA